MNNTPETLEQLNQQLAVIKNKMTQEQLGKLAFLKSSLKFREDKLKEISSASKQWNTVKAEWHKMYDQIVDFENEMGLIAPAKAFFKFQLNKNRGTFDIRKYEAGF